MNNYFIVKVDIGAKQRYIFSSNKLKEIIGASEIIRFITENLGRKVLGLMGKSPTEFTGNNEGNILSEAGGNAMYIFENSDDAKNFSKTFSSFIVKNFEGIELIMVAEEFDMDKKRITDIYDDIEELIKNKKGNRKSQFRRLSYGLTEICSRTKRPAGYERKEEKKAISKESRDKLDFYEAVAGEKQTPREYTLELINKENEIVKRELLQQADLETRLLTKVKLSEMKGFEFTNKLDDIAGAKGEGSYIGVICIDGNGMGDKIESFKDSIKKEPIKTFNERYINGFRELTENIKVKYINAFNATVQEIVDSYDNYYKEIGFDKEKNILPIRRIILAGDDITFITNGKIAVEAARRFTELINGKDNAEKFGDREYHLTTSAGVAIVKSNYPFSRAVKLANALEKNSKSKLRYIKKALDEAKVSKEVSKKDKYYDACLIDWQVSRGDTTSELSESREKLVARPYIVTNDIQNEELKSIINEINKDNKKGSLDKEQLETLGEVLNYTFHHFDQVLESVLKSQSNSSLKGFYRTMNSSEVDSKLFALKYGVQDKVNSTYSIEELNKVLFDAIDISDVYVPMKGVIE